MKTSALLLMKLQTSGCSLAGKEKTLTALRLKQPQIKFGFH